MKAVLIIAFLVGHCTLFVFGATALSGPGPTEGCRSFYITHKDAPQSVGRVICSSQIPTPDNTQRRTTVGRTSDLLVADTYT